VRIAVKQIVQNLRTGAVELAEVPTPSVRPGHVVVRTVASLISAGTERASIAVGRQSLLERARKQPQKVVDLLGRVQREGLGSTIAAVQTAIERLLPMGYCNVGWVEAVGPGVDSFVVGDRVVSNGPHAEWVMVPATLCAKVPPEVPDEQAAFTVLGAIALQGIRLAEPTLGERFAVAGLGIIGLLVVQLLRAQGVGVLAIDRVPERLALARQFGAEVVSPDADPVVLARRLSRGHGLDGVVLATSTDSDEPLNQAAQMCRKRGRIVLVGVAGLTVRRAEFYEKELTFQVSSSYGPGRYDPAYEQQGHDYPLGFVRWTAGRNFEAILDTLAARRIDVMPLLSKRFAIDQATEAYELLSQPGPTLGVLFDYPRENRAIGSVTVGSSPAKGSDRPAFALIGAGAHAAAALVPALTRAGGHLRTVVTRGGLDAVVVARRFGAEQAATDIEAVLADPRIDAVMIATPHDSHAKLTVAALRAGKHVYVEKPLALRHAELDDIAAAYADAANRLLAVGFNRRFSPLTIKLRDMLANIREPKSVVVTVNAGTLAAGHWGRRFEVSGGRVIGEGCHFVDLMIDLLGASSVDVAGAAVAGGPERLSAVLTFPDGSTGTLLYLDHGHASFPKERIEVFTAARVYRIDDFKRLEAFGVRGFKGTTLRHADKGVAACVAAFVDAVRRGGPAPMSFDSLMNSSRATLDVAAAVGQLP
jgi:predicted dehydrogenase